MKRNPKKSPAMLLLAGFILAIFVSCDYSYFEIEKLPDYHYGPVLALPLVNTSLSLSDIVPDSEGGLIQVGDDQLISLVYKDRLLSARGGMFFQLSEQQFTASFSSSPPGKNTTQTITRTFSFSTGFNDQLDSLKFLYGEFQVFLMVSGLAADGFQALVNITIPGSYNSQGQPFTMQVAANNNATASLQGFTIPFYSSGGNHNLFDVHYHVAYSGSGTPNNAPYTFSLDQSFRGMRLSSMFGLLAERTLNMGGMGIDIGIFSSGAEGTIAFEDPMLRVTALNSFGTPMNITANDLYLINDDGQVSLTGFPSPWTIAAPGINQVGQQANTNFVLNRQNSNVYEAVDFQPENLFSSFLATINPGGTGPVFVADQSQLELKVELELPLYGSAQGFSLTDTINLERTDTITEIEWIELRIEAVNNMPVDFNLQLVFTDAQYNVQMVLWEGVDDFNLIPAAQVDGQGNVISHQQKTTIIYLNEGRTYAFLNSENLILKAKVNTANAGQVPVKVFNDQTLDVRIGARIKGKVVIEF